jgi:hypothetical protein
MTIKQPSVMFRAMVLGIQGVFFNLFFFTYLVSPAAAHRFVGYLEEEACITYTRCIEDMKKGWVPEWQDKPAPSIAIVSRLGGRGRTPPQADMDGRGRTTGGWRQTPTCLMSSRPYERTRQRIGLLTTPSPTSTRRGTSSELSAGSRVPPPVAS